MGKRYVPKNLQGKSIYPLDLWFDGEWHILERGKDFSRPSSGVAHNLRILAKMRGLNVQVDPNKDTLFVWNKGWEGTT